MATWSDLSINKSFERRKEINKENELVEIDVLSYGLYEDLYKCNTLSVEQVYTEIWD
jgi:hypothetical protein